MARVLIAGCGDVGCALGTRLAAREHQVWGLRRNVTALPSGILPLPGDLTQPSTLRRLPPDLDWVVYAAAAAARSDDAYRATYPEGLGHVIDALQAMDQHLSKLVFTSSTGVYGQDDGSWVDETSPTAPATFTGTRMIEAERVLHRAPWKSISVRFGGIYGPGRTRLLRRARSGEPIARHPPRWTNRIHRDDCAGVLEHLLSFDDPAGVYVAVDDEPTMLGDVVDFLCVRAGWPRPLAPAIGEAGDGARGKRCRNRLLRATGYAFRHPTFRHGYGELIDCFDQAPPPARERG